jgi:predicted thioesterase
VTDADAGLRVEVIYRVAAQDTAAFLGSGDVPSLATPRALAMLEAATVRIVESLVEPGQTSVGVEVHLQHRVATPVGRDVHARARLIRTEGRRLYFEVELTDTERVVASGQVVRTLVDRARFIAGLDQS